MKYNQLNILLNYIYKINKEIKTIIRIFNIKQKKIIIFKLKEYHSIYNKSNNFKYKKVILLYRVKKSLFY